MPRRRRGRQINRDYKNIFYKPAGIPLQNLKIVDITDEELEVLRLRYKEKLSQQDAATKMGISQSQYQRDLVSVLEKITDAFIEGKGLKVGE
jgi:predicted DNA-binding protein (UPF0251 family)